MKDPNLVANVRLQKVHYVCCNEFSLLVHKRICKLIYTLCIIQITLSDSASYFRLRIKTMV